MKRLWPWFAALAALSALPFSDATGRFGVASTCVPLFLFALVALGLNLVVGFAGQLNLSAAAFFGIGAYTTGILTSTQYPFQWSFWSACLAAPAASALAGVLLGSPALRLRGDYLAIVTLGFGEMLQVVLRNLDTVTKGTQGINSVAAPSWLGREFYSTDALFWYFLSLAALALGVAVSAALEHSRLGRAWMAIREDELAASCMGVRATRAKLTAFAASAAFAGLAGALHASYLQNTDPGSFIFNHSIMFLCMVIIGGMGSLPGVLIGAAVIVLFDGVLLPWLTDRVASGRAGPSNILLDFKSWKWLLFGLALILMMRFRPEGIWPSRRVRDELRSAS